MGPSGEKNYFTGLRGPENPLVTAYFVSFRFRQQKLNQKDKKL